MKIEQKWLLSLKKGGRSGSIFRKKHEITYPASLSQSDENRSLHDEYS